MPGREGFLFHDGHNRAIHQAAPGLMGLLEGRQVMARWHPGIVRWMDGTRHFFNHILHEFAGEPVFEPVRMEIEGVRSVEARPEVASRFLFQYLTSVTAGLEREAAGADSSGASRSRPPATDVSERLSLNGEWIAYYREGFGRYATMPVKLPVNWELLPGIDNYAGAMRFTRRVRLPEDLGGRRLYLAFEGVDYFADVWVNGHYAGGHEGFFAPFELDVTPFLRPGEDNLLRLAVTSPNEPAGGGTHVTSAWDDFSPSSYFPNRKTLVKGTLGHHDAKRGGAWSSLTSQDGNTGGVWGDVALRPRNPVHLDASHSRITTVSVRPSRDDDGWTAKLHLSFSIRNTTAVRTHAVLHVDVEPANFEGAPHRITSRTTLKPGLNRVGIERDVAGLQLWEPWDHGFPHLYAVRATVEVDGRARDRAVIETGFRSLAVTPLGESPGPHGAFLLNGHPVFVRGTNLLPTYWLSEYDDERVARDVRMLQAAGFNAVLVHALVAPKRLYEAANRAGIMVVQISPLQWSYQQSAEFVARATHQVREMATFLYNEPSVVSYEAHNEPDMRTAADLDNRHFDFVLHAALREADPFRWATTFSGGNHAYPGQFYALRDDNSFATLPGRFEHDHHAGRRIARHRNMPTEFGIQGMPHLALFEELVSEDRVRTVLRRIRTDPAWLASGGVSWEDTEATLARVARVLGGGSWQAALDALDWRRLWRLGGLDGDVVRLRAASTDPESDPDLAETELALLVLDVLHYGAFKGENFWFGDWRPARTPAQFVAASQNRQYRLHKDAIESYLNAGTTGPIVGYFGFMFRDADWQAPTWGIVDAAWVPKKAYRAHVESNQPVRVTLPQALQSPVKLPGDSWFGTPAGRARPVKEPWATAEVIVANDSSRPLPGARVTVWLEDAARRPIPFVDRHGQARRTLRFPADLAPRSGLSDLDGLPEVWAADRPDRWVVPADLAPGTYQLCASVATAQGERLSTNSYEMVLLDTTFPFLAGIPAPDLAEIVDGTEGRPGFHYWEEGRVAYAAGPGVRGLVDGFRAAQAAGVDVYEVVQGEHLFRHVLAEHASLPAAEPLLDDVWTIRSEIISPSEKADVLLRYLDAFVARAGDRRGDAAGPDTGPSAPVRPVPERRHGRPPIATPTRIPRAVGRDLPATASPRASKKRKEWLP